MTVVVGVVQGGTVYLGADSAVSAGCERLQPCEYVGKLVRRDGLLFACTGPTRLSQLMALVLVVPPDGEVSAYRYLVTRLAPAIREMIREHDGLSINNCHDGWEMLVAYRGRLYSIAHDLSVQSYAEYASVGCGHEIALGSLHTTAQILDDRLSAPVRVGMALEAAAEHDIHCAGPFEFETLESAE
jgi:ATP-dependent protease HslVU (ClpYQ) peptidase subunit